MRQLLAVLVATLIPLGFCLLSADEVSSLGAEPEGAPPAQQRISLPLSARVPMVTPDEPIVGPGTRPGFANARVNVYERQVSEQKVKP